MGNASVFLTHKVRRERMNEFDPENRQRGGMKFELERGRGYRFHADNILANALTCAFWTFFCPSPSSVRSVVEVAASFRTPRFLEIGGVVSEVGDFGPDLHDEFEFGDVGGEARRSRSFIVPRPWG